MSYVDWFLSLKCLPGLVKSSRWTAKEIDESVAAFHALRKLYEPTDKDLIICVGDGKWCRTGVLCSFLTKSQVFSVDPEVNENWVPKELGLYCSQAKHPVVENLTLYKGKAEWAPIDEAMVGATRTIVLMVHSHAPFESLWRRLPEKTLVIGIPCCKPYDKAIKPMQSFKDERLKSTPHNLIQVWEKP